MVALATDIEDKKKNGYGTGSCPLPPHGWQLKIRLVANHPPRNKPCFCRASVGLYLQEAGVNGEMKF